MTSPDPVHVDGQLDLTGQLVPASQVARPNPERVGIEVELYIDLSAADCWGGTPPEQWDLTTLRDEIEARYAGNFAAWLADWNLGAAGVVARLTASNTSQPMVYVRGLT